MSENSALNNHLEAVTENSKTVRNIYLSYLGFATFIWMTTESVTHLQLLVPEERLPLPVLGIKLSVVGFFWVAPILLFLFHIYFALHVWKLAELLHKVRMETKGKLRDLQDKIPGSMFVWIFLESPRRGGLVSMLMSVFVFLSFWCVVPIVLLRCQWQFLPYHHATINFLIQILLILSLVLSGFFYLKVMRIKPSKSFFYCFNKDGSLDYWNYFITDFRKFKYLIFKYGSILFSLLFVVLIPFFSTTVLIIPQDKEENEACFEGVQKPFEWIAVALDPEAPNKGWENEKGIKEACLKIKDVINRNLVLREKILAIKPSDTLIAAYKDKPDEIFEKYGTLELKGRHLEFADFTKADLRKADLRWAQLQGANLENAKLKGVNFEGVHLQEANLKGAQLQGLNLTGANLQYASLKNARLQGAKLGNARLQGADLSRVYFQGADLSHAQFQGANFDGIVLQGVDLSFAQLQGVRLMETRLQGAKLYKGQLHGALLYKVELQGADLSSAQLQGARLLGIEFHGVDLSSAQLQGATFAGNEYQNTNFLSANMGPLEFSEKELITLIKKVPQGRNNREKKYREQYVDGLQRRVGEKTDIRINKDMKISHSFKKSAVSVFAPNQFGFTRNPFAKVPFLPKKIWQEQFQFKDVKSQAIINNGKIRKKIYLSLLCKNPILIKRQLENINNGFGENRFPSPLYGIDGIKYAYDNCPQHLPEEIRLRQGHLSTSSG